MLIHPPPKPSRLSTTTGMIEKFEELADWVEYYRGAANVYARAAAAPRDPFIPPVRRDVLRSVTGRLAALPIFDLTYFWLSCCRLHEMFMAGMKQGATPVDMSQDVSWQDLDWAHQNLIVLLVSRASKLLEEVAQTTERREQKQVAAGLEVDTYQVNDWLNFYFEQGQLQRFLPED